MTQVSRGEVEEGGAEGRDPGRRDPDQPGEGRLAGWQAG